MKTGTLPLFTAPSLALDDAPSVPAVLPALMRLLMGLGGWPDDQAIRVGVTGQRGHLVFARVPLARQVIEILFDPTTGRYECIGCQSTAIDLPSSIEADTDGGLIHAVMRGLSPGAAAALLRVSPTLLDIWPFWAATAGPALEADEPASDDGVPDRVPGTMRRKAGG